MNQIFLRVTALLVVALPSANRLSAQTTEPSGNSAVSSSSPVPSSTALPNAPSASTISHPSKLPAPSPYAESGFRGPIHFSASCGGGLDVQQGTSLGHTELCGVAFGWIPYTSLEIGGVGLQDGSAHFYLSEDVIAPLTPVLKRFRGEPLGIVGYTKIVGNSNRFDYGVGWQHHLTGSQSLALEARDYLQFTSPVQHMVMLRLTIVTGGDWVD